MYRRPVTTISANSKIGTCKRGSTATPSAAGLHEGGGDPIALSHDGKHGRPPRVRMIANTGCWEAPCFFRINGRRAEPGGAHRVPAAVCCDCFSPPCGLIPVGMYILSRTPSVRMMHPSLGLGQGEPSIQEYDLVGLEIWSRGRRERDNRAAAAQLISARLVIVYYWRRKINRLIGSRLEIIDSHSYPTSIGSRRTKSDASESSRATRGPSFIRHTKFFMTCPS